MGWDGMIVIMVAVVLVVGGGMCVDVCDGRCTKG